MLNYLRWQMTNKDCLRHTKAVWNVFSSCQFYKCSTYKNNIRLRSSFLMGKIGPLFVYFQSSHKNNNSTNFTWDLNLGQQMLGSDESTELWWQPV